LGKISLNREIPPPEGGEKEKKNGGGNSFVPGVKRLGWRKQGPFLALCTPKRKSQKSPPPGRSW
jgi:hypothetical protein